MAGRVPAIPTRTEFAKDAIPVSKHPMAIAGSSPAMTGLPAREVRQQQGRRVSVSVLHGSNCRIAAIVGQHLMKSISGLAAASKRYSTLQASLAVGKS